MLLKRFKRLLQNKKAGVDSETLLKIIMWAVFLAIMVLVVSFIIIKFGAKV